MPPLDYIDYTATRREDLAPLLSAAEEKHLLRLAAAGDQAAFNKLVESNLRLVTKLALRYGRESKLSLADRKQEGVIGLMKAIRRFDPDRGLRLSTYAVWWIRQAILRTTDEKGATIRLPTHVYEDRRALAAAVEAITQRLGRRPSDEELLAELDWNRERFQRVRRSPSETSSLDKIDPEDNRALSEILSDPNAINPEDAAIRKSLAAVLATAMDECLSEREQTVLKLRFGLTGDAPMALDEIANILNLTRETIRLTEKGALKKLRSRTDLTEWKN